MFFSGNFALLTIIYCVVASNLVSLSVLAYVVFDGIHINPSLQLFKKSLKYGIWIYAGTLFAFFILRLNLLMVNYYLGPLKSGIFSIALSISDALYLLPTTIGMVAFASFVKERDLLLKWKMVKRIALSLACLLIALFGMVLLFTHELTVLLYGNKFSDAIEPIRWLLPGLFCLSILTQFQNFLSSVENPKLVCIGPFIAVLVNVAANLILIPRYELLGAAAATSLSYAVWLAITLTLSANKVKNEQHRTV
jgi:O-antigen/teichoic acid export membrane protein